MKAVIKNGGPAFPYREEDGQGGYEQHQGMSLRDYFAAQTLTGVIPSIEIEIDKLDTDSKHFDHNVNCFYQSAAVRAYCYADAMLTAREASK